MSELVSVSITRCYITVCVLTVFFSLLQQQNDAMFIIDHYTGEIVATAVFDRETLNQVGLSCCFMY
jgi:hypothetical protein